MHLKFGEQLHAHGTICACACGYNTVCSLLIFPQPVIYTVFMHAKHTEYMFMHAKHTQYVGILCSCMLNTHSIRTVFMHAKHTQYTYCVHAC